MEATRIYVRHYIAGDTMKATLALTAAFAITGCDLQEQHNDPVEKLAEIHTLYNAQGQSSRATIVYNESFESFFEKRAKGKGYKGDRLESMLHSHVANHLKHNGFDKASANKTAKDIIEGFRPYIHAEIQLPATAVSENIWQNIWAAKPIPSPECTVTQLASVYETQQWAKNFVRMDEDKRHWKIPHNFEKEIFEFTRDHELAHCMGANEQQADKVAAKLLLKRHPDKAKALAFLELMKAVRTMDSFGQINRDYHGTLLAIDRVIKDFKIKKTIPQSAEEIWSEALERPNFGAEHVADLLRTFRVQKDLVRHRNFNGMAEFLSKEAISMEHGPRKEVAATMVDGFRFLGSIVQGPAP